MSTKLTPLHHAPLVDVEAGNDAFGQSHAQPRRFASHQACAAAHVQRALVDRAAGDRADDAARGFARQQLDVLDGGDAAGGDHRDARGLRHAARGRNVHALHHAVAGDVGVDDRGHAVSFELLREIGGAQPARPRPSHRWRPCRLRASMPDDHAARKRGAGVGDELRLLHRHRADDHLAARPHPGSARWSRAMRMPPPICTGRSGNAFADRAHRRAVDRLAREGAVQVHQMQAPAPSCTQRAAIATGSSPKTVVSSIRPWRRRTQARPSGRWRG